MTQWINLPLARKALHVPINSYFFNADNGNGRVFGFVEMLGFHVF
jgi:hypothetical protein